GLAISGLIVGIIGLVIGAALWTLLIVSPENVPVAAANISEKQRKTLRDLNVLQADEDVELFCPTGMFSIREGGVVITDGRLVTYSTSGSNQSFLLREIESIDYTPAANMLREGHFTVTNDDGKVMSFTINGMHKGDQLFHRTLQRRVSKLRKDAGK